MDSPSTTYLVFDSGTYYLIIFASEDDVAAFHGAFWYLPGTQKLAGCVAPAPTSTFGVSDFTSNARHFDGNNVIFADGHVKWIKTVTMFTQAAKYKAGAYAKTVQSAWNPYNSN